MNQAAAVLSRLPQRNIAFGVIGASVLGAVLWFTSAYQPAQAQVDTLNTEITTLTTDVQTGEAAKAGVRNLCISIVDLRVKRAELLKKLPPSERLSSLLDELRGKITANNGKILELSRGNSSFGSTAAIPGVRPVSITLSVENTFLPLYQNIAAIEQLQRFAKVESITMQPSQQSQGFGAAESGPPKDPTLRATTVITAYVFNPATVGGTAAGASGASATSLVGDPSQDKTIDDLCSTVGVAATPPAAPAGTGTTPAPTGTSATPAPAGTSATPAPAGTSATPAPTTATPPATPAPAATPGAPR
jgi:Tfp pilus assembly protein PilO